MTSNGPTSVKSDRVGAVRRLSNRKFREKVGRFLVEGPQAVREAIRHRPEVIDEIFVFFALIVALLAKHGGFEDLSQ